MENLSFCKIKIKHDSIITKTSLLIINSAHEFKYRIRTFNEIVLCLYCRIKLRKKHIWVRKLPFCTRKSRWSSYKYIHCIFAHSQLRATTFPGCHKMFTIYKLCIYSLSINNENNDLNDLNKKYDIMTCCYTLIYY